MTAPPVATHRFVPKAQLSDPAKARSTPPSPWLAVSGVALSALSLVILIYTSSEEPFHVFRWSDLFLVAVLGGIVFALFVSFAVAAVRGYRRSPHPGALAKLFVCASVLWTAINLFYLGFFIYGYFQDLTNPNFGPWR